MSKAVYHHQIPQTYLKAWGESVYVYYKEKNEGKIRNIEKEFGVNYFYSIRPGDMFVRPESLDMFFSRLDPYFVVYIDKPDDGEEGEVEEVLLNTKEKQNQYWNESKDWIIQNKDGKAIPKAEQNRLLTEISQEKDNYIEDAWSSKFENIWTSVIEIVRDHLWDIHQKKPKSLAYEDKQTLIEYYVMFDWRKPTGPKRVRESFDNVMSLFPDGTNNYPWKQKGHPKDKTLGDAIWHMILNSSFYKFINNDGMMKKYCDAFMKETTFEFYLDSKDRLITSDSPCFEHINEDGKIEPLFVALPGLLIQAAKKDPERPLEYNIFELTDDEVDRYNRIIFENGDQIVAKNEKQITDLLAKAAG